MTKLVPCPSCARHRRQGSAPCPHCQAPGPAGTLAARLTRHARIGGLALFTAVTATACYGTPPAPDMAGMPSPSPTPGASPSPSQAP